VLGNGHEANAAFYLAPITYHPAPRTFFLPLPSNPQWVSQSAVSQQSEMPLVRNPQCRWSAIRRHQRGPVHESAFPLSSKATAI